MGRIESMVDGKISDKKVMVFSKSYCPYCAKAKKVLKEYNLSATDYEVMEIDNNPDGDQIQDYLQKKTGSRSVPRVFINRKCIGGGDETVALQKSGKLQQMINETVQASKF